MDFLRQHSNVGISDVCVALDVCFVVSSSRSAVYHLGGCNRQEVVVRSGKYHPQNSLLPNTTTIDNLVVTCYFDN